MPGATGPEILWPGLGTPCMQPWKARTWVDLRTGLPGEVRQVWGQGQSGGPSVSKGSGSLSLFLPQEAMKVSDGRLLGDPRHTSLSKKQGVKWQRPRLTRQALTQCCLVKWILSSAAPQGSGRGWGRRAEGGAGDLF